MEYPRGSFLGVSAAGATRQSRRCPRHALASVAYVTIDTTNGGILRDISDGGLALQCVTPLNADQEVRLRFQLPSPKASVETNGRVCWATASGQAGVEFVDLPLQASRLLKEWLLVQLLTRAYHGQGRESIFSRDVTDPSFTVSGSARVPITLVQSKTASATADRSKPARMFELPWIPFSFSVRTLAAIVDGLVLLAAVLVFATLTLSMIHTVPVWPWSGLLGVFATAAFAGVYRWLFIGNVGFTPGMYLAQVAAGEDDSASRRRLEPRTRFR